MDTRPTLALRPGCNEDPSQMMPALFAGPTPSGDAVCPASLWNPQGSSLPPSMLQAPKAPWQPQSSQAPPMAASQRFPSVSGGGTNSPWGTSAGSPSYGGSSGSPSIDRRTSFDMPELKGQLYQPYSSGKLQRTEDEDASCVSDGTAKGATGMDVEGTSRFSNSSLNRQAFGAAMAQKMAAQHLAGASGNMNTNLNLSNVNMTSSSINNLTSVSASSNASGRSGASRGASSMGMSLQGAGSSGAECRRFTPVQVHKATDGYNQANVLGHGAFGTVFKGKLMGCQVAVKRLEGGGWQGPGEYRTEVEVLSHMRHPNIVLLMGHCPEDHCLIYEYLPMGSLQDFLNPSRRRKQLPWADRVRVMAEITSALLYLHHHEPPIAHRDLKPDNVLLDSNLTSKLGDVGLARLVVEDDNMTARVRGTAGYIDPEEVVTCEVSVLSDIYAFGLIALQLLLGEPNVKSIQKLLNDCAGAAGGGGRGLSRAADVIMEHLDPSCGAWNRDIARPLVILALRCADQKRMRRPDIAEELQPALQRAAEEAAAELQKQRAGLEAQLSCPLSESVMTDPVVASDGFTYERSAIETWLLMNDTSPSTGEPMAHKFLTPNNGLRQLLESGKQ